MSISWDPTSFEPGSDSKFAPNTHPSTPWTWDSDLPLPPLRMSCSPPPPLPPPLGGTPCPRSTLPNSHNTCSTLFAVAQQRTCRLLCCHHHPTEPPVLPTNSKKPSKFDGDRAKYQDFPRRKCMLYTDAICEAHQKDCGGTIIYDRRLTQAPGQQRTTPQFGRRSTQVTCPAFIDKEPDDWFC